MDWTKKSWNKIHVCLFQEIKSIILKTDRTGLSCITKLRNDDFVKLNQENCSVSRKNDKMGSLKAKYSNSANLSLETLRAF